MCESRENDLQDLLHLADSAANAIEKLVLDGGKIPEVSSGSFVAVTVRHAMLPAKYHELRDDLNIAATET